MTPLRLLHISDLHFRGDGRPLTADVKKPRLRTRRAPPDPLGKAVEDSQGDRFIAQLLATVLHGTPQTEWPKAIVVSGDIVDRGGTDGDEFAHAVAFLKKLTKTLRIRDEFLLVVPGNHDVNWSPGLQLSEKFSAFNESMRDFVAPNVERGEFCPKWANISLDTPSDAEAEFLLFSSPTFSGVPDPDMDTLLKKLKGWLRDAAPADRERIERAVKRAMGTMDIGAIGTTQRRAIATVPNDERKVRIAVLHHHLLPHPQVEITPFESVVDAGQVLSDLIDAGFDLVLTGHKHSRQLVQYRKGDRAIDVLTAPSLFEGPNPGFSIVDVLGGEQPCYARVWSYSTDCTLIGRKDLVRSGRVPADVVQLCAAMSPDDQSKRLSPVLESLTGAFAWLHEEGAPVELFEKVWTDQITTDIRSLKERRLVFRPPSLGERWRELLELAAKRGGTLRLVSNDDIGLWKEPRLNGTFAHAYGQPIQRFPAGKKSRVLIVPEVELRDAARAAEWADVINEMVEKDGIEVSLVLNAAVRNFVTMDFGIVGNFAVSKFIGGGQQVRALEESFNPGDVARAENDWTILQQAQLWSSSGRVSFSEWRENNYGGGRRRALKDPPGRQGQAKILRGPGASKLTLSSGSTKS